MSRSAFAGVLAASPVMLLSGPIETRLRYEFGRPSPNGASFLQLFDPDGRVTLRAIYKGYMEVARDYGLPLMVDTPTWRAHPDGLARQGFGADLLAHVIAEAVGLVRDLRWELDLTTRVFIGGVVGPRFDGYSAEGAPDVAASEAYHAPQVRALKEEGVDFLYAPTFSTTSELLGVSKAFAATGLPYVVAPVIDTDGHLADGNSLAHVIACIEAGAHPGPACYAVGCVHPDNFLKASGTGAWPSGDRIAGLAANGSPLPHVALNHLDHVATDGPETFADLMIGLHRRGVKILGGCCGTDDRHLRALAKRFASG